MNDDIICMGTFVGLFVGLFMVFYLTYRFSSWELIQDYTKTEFAVMKMVKSKAEGAEQEVKPLGRALLRKRLLSYRRVFKNGIFTDVGTVYFKPFFSWVPVGGSRMTVRVKAGFIPFSSISGIYPMTVQYRTRRAGKRLEHSSSRKALQIETTDGRTAIIYDTWDFGKLIPALQRAMGSSWDDMYRDTEELVGWMIIHRWSTGKSSRYAYFGYRDLHKHRLIRAAPGYDDNRRRSLEANKIDTVYLQLFFERGPHPGRV
jgi:hypothetical protein